MQRLFVDFLNTKSAYGASRIDYSLSFFMRKPLVRQSLGWSGMEFRTPIVALWKTRQRSALTYPSRIHLRMLKTARLGTRRDYFTNGFGAAGSLSQGEQIASRKLRAEFVLTCHDRFLSNQIEQWSDGCGRKRNTPAHNCHSSCLNNFKLSRTGRSVTEKIIAGSFLDLFSNLCQVHDGTKKQSRARHSSSVSVVFDLPTDVAPSPCTT